MRWAQPRARRLGCCGVSLYSLVDTTLLRFVEGRDTWSGIGGDRGRDHRRNDSAKSFEKSSSPGNGASSIIKAFRYLSIMAFRYLYRASLSCKRKVVDTLSGLVTREKKVDVAEKGLIVCKVGKTRLYNSSCHCKPPSLEPCLGRAQTLNCTA
jgi:hypothetical protein